MEPCRGEWCRRGADLHVIEAVPDTPVQVGDSDVFPLEPQVAAPADAISLDFPLPAPAPHGGGGDAKGTGDPGGGQQGFSGPRFIPRTPRVEMAHQVSPVTLS